MAATERTFSARLGCRYLLQVPEDPGPRTTLVAALHGFSSNAEDMLRLTSRMVGPGHAIAAIEGPYGFFRGEGTDQVGYGWITNRRAPESIRLHHEMVRHVLEEAGGELGTPAESKGAAGIFPAGLLELSLCGGASGCGSGRGGHLRRAARAIGTMSTPAAYGQRCCISRATRTSSTRRSGRNNMSGDCVFVVMTWSSIFSKAVTPSHPGVAPCGRAGRIAS